MKTLILFSGLLICGGLGYGQVNWVPNHSGGKLPKHAIVGGHEGKTELYVCRAKLWDGIHPGKSTGGVCLVGQKGKVETRTEFEIATARHYRWGHWSWNVAVIAGKQLVNGDLYVCRVHIDGAIVPGKAYSSGDHAGHCFVPFGGRELNFANDFELLRIER